MIVKSGLLLQLDCPDLAMGRHTRFKNLSDDGVSCATPSCRWRP